MQRGNSLGFLRMKASNLSKMEEEFVLLLELNSGATAFREFQATMRAIQEGSRSHFEGESIGNSKRRDGENKKTVSCKYARWRPFQERETS